MDKVRLEPAGGLEDELEFVIEELLLTSPTARLLLLFPVGAEDKTLVVIGEAETLNEGIDNGAFD